MSEKPDETSTPAEEAGGKLSFTLTAYRDGRQVGEMEMTATELHMVCRDLRRCAIAKEEAIKKSPLHKRFGTQPAQKMEVLHRILRIIASTRRCVVYGGE